MTEKTTKRATKKALETFCNTNGITSENIWIKLSSLYPNKYIQSDKLIGIIIKGLFKAYDNVDDSIIISYLKQLDDENKLYSYTVESKVYVEFHKKLRSILEKVKEDVMEEGDVLLSSYPEFSPDLLAFIRKNYTWKSCFTDEGDYSYGRAFYCFFSYWYYNNYNPPFHCYSTNDGKDVLFTTERQKWIESEGRYEFEVPSSNTGCMVMIVALIICSILVACGL